MSSAEEGLISETVPHPFLCCRLFFPCFFKTRPLDPQFSLKTAKSREISIQRSEILSHSNTCETEEAKKQPEIVKKPSKNGKKQSEIEEKPEKNVENVDFSMNLDEKKGKNERNLASGLHPIENLPTNKLFLLENSDKKRVILLKITEKRFDVTKNKKNASNIHVPKDYRQKIPISVVIEHVVSRIKGNFCLDLSNGIGEYTVPMLKQCEYLISVFDSQEKCEKTAENAGKKGAEMGNFVNFENFAENDVKGRFDSLFLNPYTIFPDFCSKNLNKESTISLLYKLRRKTRSFVMFLHRNTDNLDNLIELLSGISQRQTRTSFEIQKIYYNEKLKFLYIYHGEVNTISSEDEIDCIRRFFMGKCQGTLELGIKVHALLEFLNKTLGNSRIMAILQKTAEKTAENSDFFENFKKIVKKTRPFQKSTSISGSNLRFFKPSLMMSPLGNNNSEMMGDEMNEPSFIERPYSINEEFRHSEEDLNEKRSNSSDDYYLSEYSLNNSSNEELTDFNRKTMENQDNEDFEIIQTSLGDPKLSMKIRQSSFSGGREEGKKELVQTKTLEKEVKL